MAANVTGQVNITGTFTQVNATGIVAPTAAGGTLSLQATLALSLQLANAAGVAMGIDQLYAAQLTLAASTTTLTFASGGGLLDLAGGAIAMGRIRFFAVQVVTITAAFDVGIYKAASNGVSWLPASTGPVYARANLGLALFVDQSSSGSSVGNYIDGTHKSITLDPSANTVVVNVIAAGNSVA